MSVVTDIILVTETDELLHVGDDSFLDTSKLSNHLVEVGGLAGGNKHMQCDVFAAAINHLDHEDLIRRFRFMKWNNPDSVQLFIRREEDDLFKVYTP